MSNDIRLVVNCTYIVSLAISVNQRIVVRPNHKIV